MLHLFEFLQTRRLEWTAFTARRRSPSYLRAQPRPSDEAELASLRDALRTDRDRAIVELLHEGGLRLGEVLGLQVAEDVRFGRRQVIVRHRRDDAADTERSMGSSAPSLTDRQVRTDIV